MNNIAVIIIFIYLLVNAAFSVVSTVHDRKNSRVEDHMVSRGAYDWPIIAFSVFGVAIAGGGTMSVTTDAYTRGLGALWTNWSSVIVYSLFLLISVPMYRVMLKKFGQITSSGAFEVRFDKKCSILNSAVCILFFVLCVALQPTAVASVLCPLTGWDRTAVIIVSGIFFTLVTIFGGMKGVIWISFANAIVMVSALMYVCISGVNAEGGLSAVMTALPEGHKNLFSAGFGGIVESVLSLVFGCLFLSNNAAVALTAKNDKVLKKGWIIGVALIFVLSFVNVGIGLVAYCHDSSLPSGTSIMSYVNSVSPVFAGLFGCGIMGAIFSSAPASVMAASNHITEDIYHRFLKPDASDRQRMLVSKLSCLAVGILAIALAFMSSSMITLFYAAMQIIAPTGIVLLAGLFWKRLSANAAFWAIFIGTPVAFIWFLLGNPMGVSAFRPSAIATVVIMVVVTLASKEAVAPGYARYIAAKKECESEAAADM